MKLSILAVLCIACAFSSTALPRYEKCDACNGVGKVERECRNELDKFDAETKILMTVMSAAKSFNLSKVECLMTAYAFEQDRDKKRKALLEKLASLRKAVS